MEAIAFPLVYFRVVNPAYSFIVKKAQGRRQKAFMEQCGGGFNPPPIASHQIKDARWGTQTKRSLRSPEGLCLRQKVYLLPSALCPLPSAFLVETLKVGDIALRKTVFTKSVNPPIPEEFGIGGI
jgi:hypothetical protein